MATVARIQFTRDLNAATAAAQPTLTATAGVALPVGFVADKTHLWVVKNCTATIGIWAYSSNIGNWARMDSLAFGGTNSEIYYMQGLAGYNRVQTTVDAIGASGSLSTYFGFVEGD